MNSVINYRQIKDDLKTTFAGSKPILKNQNNTVSISKLKFKYHSRHCTFIMGATTGITTVVGIPSCCPW